MPTYQYACTNADCGNRFELVQSFTDSSVTECPVCGQRVRKVYGSVGVVFKGSGFYRNDSREATKGASRSGSETAGSDAVSTGEAKASESKSSQDSGGSATGTAPATDKPSSDSAPKSGASQAANGSASSSTAPKSAPKAPAAS
jgi:putative FmdB family regulatory protein